MRKKKPKPGAATVYTSKLFTKILKEITPEQRKKTNRQLTGISKWYGIRRRILEKKYRPKYNKSKNSEQGRLIFLLEGGCKVMVI